MSNASSDSSLTDALSVVDLTFTYRNATQPALANLSFRQSAGEFIVLAGPAGAGKSTFCRCLNGLVPKFQKGELHGEVRVFKDNVADWTVHEMATRVGIVFQDFEAQLFSTNVALEVAFGLENMGMDREEMRQRVREALATVGLSGMESRDPSTLSGGQKQRLAIAAVLAMQPDLLVMDEPTTDLDPAGKAEVFRVARELRRQGNTLLLVEHEIEEATDADRIVLFSEGKVVAEGSPSEIFTDVATLEAQGISAPQIPALLNKLGEPPRLLNVLEAITYLEERGWKPSRSACDKLVRQDGERESKYGETFIEVENLTYRYARDIEALTGLSLTIRRGEFVALLGQNGCGKTTLAKHLNGLLRPTEGRVTVDGRRTDVCALSDLGRRVGYVFQNPDHQIFADTVADEIAFAPRNFGLRDDEVKVRVREAMAAVDLVGYDERDPFSLTKGERQRVAVASVLAAQPEALILDEPTTGLDYRQQREMMELVHQLNTRGHTIIVITHTLWVAAEYAHRTIVMQEGRILLDAPTREAFGREDLLEAASLKAPTICRLGNQVGFTALSVEEMASTLTKEVSGES